MFKKILLIIVLFFMAVQLYAADTVTVTTENLNRGKGAFVVTLAWQAAAGGTKADYSFRTSNSGADAWIMDGIIDEGRYLYAVRTIPGTTAPAANYDIDVDDESGTDIMFSKLDNRSATATEEVNAPNVAKSVYSDLTIQWANVTNANCNGTVILYFAKYE